MSRQLLDLFHMFQIRCIGEEIFHHH
jgi:hypothetical protein